MQTNQAALRYTYGTQAAEKAGLKSSYLLEKDKVNVVGRHQATMQAKMQATMQDVACDVHFLRVYAKDAPSPDPRTRIPKAAVTIEFVEDEGWKVHVIGESLVINGVFYSEGSKILNNMDEIVLDKFKNEESFKVETKKTDFKSFFKFTFVDEAPETQEDLPEAQDPDEALETQDVVPDTQDPDEAPETQEAQPWEEWEEWTYPPAKRQCSYTHAP
jgi:hypothetical protein